MKHKIMKVQADIDRAKADKENARTVFEIRVNKMRHEENESRRAILEKQKIVSQKMRINENQRLIIIDLMDVVEQVEEAFE
jgi:hydroxymethylpyrimidine pyrophosphatase-like HAD family hydrolase